MVDADFVPDNPLGIELAEFPFPGIEFDFAGIEGSEKLTEMDPIKAPLYAWCAYGALAVIHASYYSENFYWQYIVDKHASAHMAFRTWYGVATWLRDFTKMLSWSLLLIAWAASVIPYPIFLQYFAKATTYILMIETFTIFLKVMLMAISFVAESDQYQNDHQHYDLFDKNFYKFGEFTTFIDDLDLPGDMGWTDGALQLMSVTA